MKKILTLLFSLSISFIYSQDIYNYEKKIPSIDNYTKHEIEIQNPKDELKLYGTLITPQNEFDKVIIIVPGSGKDTRYSHYRLAEEFLKNNIAIFRYDERGTGKSEGAFSNVSYGISQMTRDLFYVINTIKSQEILAEKKIGLLGHSLGGMATIGTVQKGVQVDFLIQWATPVEKHGKSLIYQVKSGLAPHDNDLKYDDLDKKIEIMNLVHQIVEENLKDSSKELRKKLDKGTKKFYKRKNWDRFKYYTFHTTRDLLRQNYEETYKNIEIPLLYIIGSEDRFVSSDDNVKLLQSYENKKIETKVFSGLNHYLRTGKINLNEKYETPILYDINKNALSEIINWTIIN